jgi:hypothetical protein
MTGRLPKLEPIPEGTGPEIDKARQLFKQKRLRLIKRRAKTLADYQYLAAAGASNDDAAVLEWGNSLDD